MGYDSYMVFLRSDWEFGGLYHTRAHGIGMGRRSDARPRWDVRLA